jgi:dolichyl-phosphate-mannose--protein O-mannosyl transferase
LALVCFGLGFSTKWIVMYGFVGLIILLGLFRWRKPIQKGEVFWFFGGVVAAVAVYMLSYIPYFLVGHGLGDWWDMQWRMFSFHSSLEATHPYGSAWYTWPLMLTPVYLAVGRLCDTTSYIVTFGNPALWWAGILAVIPAIWLAIRYRNQTAAFIVIPFLVQWLAFAPISRVLFIYHYYPNVLFMILALTLWAEWLWRRYEWGKWAVAGYLVLNVACFAAFFPIISGLPMPDGYWNVVRWMVNWAT